MGFREIAKAFPDPKILFAWLVEEVGELGRILVRGRTDGKDAKVVLEGELGDVQNMLWAIGNVLGYTPEDIVKMAEFKGLNHSNH